MARMRSLDPAVQVPLSGGWSLLATEAGRYATGLTATIALKNGQITETEQVALAKGEFREAFAQFVHYRTKIPCADIAAQLLRLLESIEGVLRQSAQQAEEARDSQATRLVAMALDAGAELFHTPDGEAYATITVDGHRATWPLRVTGVRRWLARLFYQEEEKSPGSHHSGCTGCARRQGVF